MSAMSAASTYASSVPSWTLRVVALVLLITVQYMCASAAVFTRQYQQEYTTKLAPLPDVEDVKPLPDPAWACTASCHSSPFNSTEYHCAGCFPFAKMRASQTADRKERPPVYEPGVMCQVIAHWHEEHPMLSRRPFVCEASLVDLLLASLLRTGSIEIHPGIAMCWFVSLVCLWIEVGWVYYEVRRERTRRTQLREDQAKREAAHRAEQVALQCRSEEEERRRSVQEIKDALAHTEDGGVYMNDPGVSTRRRGAFPGAM